jgi:2-polyprenyl-3-methyl-5-hydroxy-6-metoxy-1,4-benzoquinol methylase
MTTPTPALDFTGERFTPECVREIWYEHYHRYAFALPLVLGKRVLDAACGEGYGSAMIAPHAGSVLGVDLSEEAVTHARNRYGDSGARFEQADVTALDHLPAASFDLILSFETLEHLQAQQQMLAGFRRLLAPDGLLLISTPDKRNYSDLPNFRNEHHVRELYRDEFERLLADSFTEVRLYAHKLLFQSAMWTLDASRSGYTAVTLDADGRAIPALAYPPLYYMAVCANQSLPELPAMALFGDDAESVYAHYNHEIRKNIAAGARILELEHALAQAEARLAVLNSQPKDDA